MVVDAEVVKLVYTLALGARAFGRAGSSPAFGTTTKTISMILGLFFYRYVVTLEIYEYAYFYCQSFPGHPND